MRKIEKHASYTFATTVAAALLIMWIILPGYSRTALSAMRNYSRAQLFKTESAVTSCSNDTWTPTSLTNAPEARESHSAVWTGSEMIIWGGFVGYTYFNNGGRYNPATDSWQPISTINAPEGRADHTAVWTGSRMIVWGGHNLADELNTGASYNPATDTWTAISVINAPGKRKEHTAVWTGTEMIVWGGITGGRYNRTYFSTGGRYNPTTDTWTATSTTSPPSGREDHTAVWTGREMIVWAGNSFGNITESGGRYNPTTDTWTPTSRVNDPNSRYLHTAVWTGSEMVVWGGFGYDTQGAQYLDTGGRYNPATDTWTPTSTMNAASLRGYHTDIWTGNEMVVWGGAPNDLKTGGRYKPATNSWNATDSASAPAGRIDHTAVWTGTEMIVWGGNNFSSPNYLNTGGRYCLSPSAPSAAPATISGRISDSNGAALAGATVSLSGARSATTFTRGDGSYRFDNLDNNQFYTVTPNLANYRFSPMNRAFSLVANQTDAEFTGNADISETTNPVDATEYFVRQHYLDFLSREPDQGGFEYWSEQINQCNGDIVCRRVRRIEVSAAFFVEQEFQRSGSYIYDMYAGALNRKPTFVEYASDHQLVIGGAMLESSRTLFARNFVERAEFAARYQANTTPESFVDAVIQNVQIAGVDLSGERANLIGSYNRGDNVVESRAEVVRAIADNTAFKQSQYNAAFVLSEYFSYLRRDPDRAGYQFWLSVLNNSGPDNYHAMVCAFITSTEYQRRFSQVVSHSNSECAQ